MTTLQEAAQAAMKYIRSTADYKAGHPVAIEAAEDLSDALAQQGEQQPYGWSHDGASRIMSEYDAKAEAKRCGGTCYAYPLYCLPPVESHGIKEGK